MDKTSQMHIKYMFNTLYNTRYYNMIQYFNIIVSGLHN